MDPVRPRYARAIAAAASVALLVVACGGPGPGLDRESVGSGDAATSVRDPSAALSVLGGSPDEDLRIENEFPALLGFDRPATPPQVLAMDDDAPSRESDLASTDDPDRDAGTGAGPTETGAETAEGTVEGTAEGTAEAAVEPLPLPPRTAPGTLPLYDNPSDTLITASGRPFDGAAPTSTGTTRGVTDDVIHIGGIVSATLAGQPFRGDACLGAEARYLQANVHLELTRRIVFDACLDDSAQSDLSAGLARALVDERTFAIAPVASPAFLADAQLAEHHVPYFGDGALPGFCGRETPYGFGTAGALGCPVLDARGYAVLSHPVLSALDAAQDEDGLPATIMLLAEAGPDGAAILASLQLEADLASLPMPVAGPTMPDAGDGPPPTWGPIVDAVLAADPDMVIIHSEVTDGLPAALHRRNFVGEVVLVGAVDPLVAADDARRAELAPLTVVTPGLDLASRDTAGWRSLSGAAAALGVKPAEIGSDFVAGYVSADLLVQALTATLEPLTAERLTQTMNDGWWYPGIEGLACGSWWPAAHYAPTPCVSVSRVEMFAPRLVPVVDLVETAPQLRFHLD